MPTDKEYLDKGYAAGLDYYGPVREGVWLRARPLSQTVFIQTYPSDQEPPQSQINTALINSSPPEEIVEQAGNAISLGQSAEGVVYRRNDEKPRYRPKPGQKQRGYGRYSQHDNEQYLLS